MTKEKLISFIQTLVIIVATTVISFAFTSIEKNDVRIEQNAKDISAIKQELLYLKEQQAAQTLAAKEAYTRIEKSLDKIELKLDNYDKNIIEFYRKYGQKLNEK